jgi:hypothetical protein
MDTNIIMNDPNPNNWSVKAGGQSLFVLSGTIVLELASIRQKKGSNERLESSHKADIASKSLASLFGQGSITEGIPVKAGWVVCVPSPKKDELDPELDQLKDIMDVLKRSDTKLLLLTRECHQLFRSTPVTLLTGDRDLYNVVQAQGVPCHLSSRFPIEGLKEAAAITTPVDWDKELAKIQAKIAKNSIVVEATLTAQRSAPPWLMLLTGTKRFIIAEGRGVMRIGNEVRPFLWAIPLYPQTIEPRSPDDNKGLADLPPIHLDFFGEDNFEQDLFDAIADRLLDCTNLTFEEGKPTLQSPQSIMEMLLYFEYLLREGVSEGALEKLRQEVKESEGLMKYWTDWILDTEGEDEQYACLEGLIEALNNCWEIGQTYTFGIIRGQEECPPE